MEEQKKTVFSQQGVIDLPSRQIRDFISISKNKIVLIARPVSFRGGKDDSVFCGQVSSTGSGGHEGLIGIPNGHLDEDNISCSSQ